MNVNEIMKMVDHTLLSQTATWEEIQTTCEDALTYGAASVCIPPAYVKAVAEYLQGRLPICTVIGFPNGYMTTEAKCFEAANAIECGADEIDMVIHVGKVKDGYYGEIQNEITAVKQVCGTKILKVIVETCFLTESEKIALCEVVVAAGADFIKTSTGFGCGGATFDDIELFANQIDGRIGIKAAGGIKSFADAERFISLGATRLGTSRLVSILKDSSENGVY